MKPIGSVQAKTANRSPKTRTVKMMKSQAVLTNHAKMVKITARAIATIGKIRLKSGLSAKLSTGLGTVPNP